MRNTRPGKFVSENRLRPRRIDAGRLMREIGIGHSHSNSTAVDQTLQDLILEAEQSNQQLLTIVARLQSHRKARLPRATRLRFLKQMMLRVIMVYSRFQDLYNSSNIAAIQALSERLDLLQRQIEVLAERLSQEADSK